MVSSCPRNRRSRRFPHCSSRCLFNSSQLLPTPHPRNRHHKVPPRVTHQPFHLPLVVALARTPELLFKQIVALQFRECPRLLPLSALQNLRHRQLRVVVENLPRHSLEISKGAHVSFQKRFRRLRRKRRYEAVVQLRQVHGEVVRLAFHSGDNHPGFSEIRLCFPRCVGQWHEHLPCPHLLQTHVVRSEERR